VRILLVEDETKVGKALCEGLRAEGYDAARPCRKHDRLLVVVVLIKTRHPIFDCVSCRQ
jgi:DNA-binding response OmpR family regulator